MILRGFWNIFRIFFPIKFVNFQVGGTVEFSCRKPYQLIGKSSFDDKVVRCQLDGTWDIGQLRCEGRLHKLQDLHIKLLHFLSDILWNNQSIVFYRIYVKAKICYPFDKFAIFQTTYFSYRICVFSKIKPFFKHDTKLP